MLPVTSSARPPTHRRPTMRTPTMRHRSRSARDALLVGVLAMMSPSSWRCPSPRRTTRQRPRPGPGLTIDPGVPGEPGRRGRVAVATTPSPPSPTARRPWSPRTGLHDIMTSRGTTSASHRMADPHGVLLVRRGGLLRSRGGDGRRDGRRAGHHAPDGHAAGRRGVRRHRPAVQHRRSSSTSPSSVAACSDRLPCAMQRVIGRRLLEVDVG